MDLTHLAIWAVSGVVALAIVLRPFNGAEVVFASLGAACLVIFQLVPIPAAFAGLQAGVPVTVFLLGMMLLADVARHTGVFDWIAAHAVRQARGHGWRLFTLIYAVGTLVTVLLSNDATAVVLTPAVAAAARAANTKPLPYLLVCAFIANAASFVLPISNPANLVIYGAQMPSLGAWLWLFGLPSGVAILATYGALRFCLRHQVTRTIAQPAALAPLSPAGRVAALGLAVSALILTVLSSLHLDFAWPTLLCGLGVLIATSCASPSRRAGYQLCRDSLRGVNWSVVPLVAGLFVLVEALGQSGVTGLLAVQLRHLADLPGLSWLVGLGVAVGSNLVNNLPMGLFAAAAAHAADLHNPALGALLIGIDLGPNLSVTGSLATLLWLVAVRREGGSISAWSFFKLGLCVTPPALALSLLALLAQLQF